MAEIPSWIHLQQQRDTLIITTDANEGLDRSKVISVADSEGNYRDVVVNQRGMREIFQPADGDFILRDGGYFCVLKSR